MKNIVSNVIDKTISLDQLISQKNSRYILAYHRIIPHYKVQENYIQPSMWTSPRLFENQIKWMLKIGEIVDIKRILDFEDENRKPLFSITFDDGWKDNYDNAFPILKKYGINATIFVVTSAIENGSLLWPEELVEKTNIALKNNKTKEIQKFIRARIKKYQPFRFHTNIYQLVDEFLEYLKILGSDQRRVCIEKYYELIGVDSSPIQGLFLSWDDIMEMDRQGIHFGSHTHSHVILSSCDEKIIEDELETSKRHLEARLNRTVDMFCYPNARYNIDDAIYLKSTGYKYAFRLHNLCLSKNESNYFLPRILMNEKIFLNPSYFKFRLLGVPRY